VNPNPGIGNPPARILIVDDDHDSREILQVVLGHEGYVTVTAASGEEALASVVQQPPELILLDARMPGMDGYDVLAKLKTDPATASIPVIMVTGMTDDAAKLRALRVGAKDVIAKPVSRAHVLARVESALGVGDDDPR
jgi:CheY-like chemotaxis protein